LKPKIPYASPSITDLEVSYATDAAANGWGDKCYDYIDRFESLFKKHLDVEYTIATSSCTGALHMGMSALGIGPGDEVILADSNWIATASPIVHLGAKPIFVDILEDSWCIDPTLAKAAITHRTKAIIATHLYGNLCEMNELLKIGREHNIAIIEDSAEAIGSVYHGRRAGSMGTFGAFSFHGTKTISTGEGGMFVTNNHDLYEKVLTLSNHGRSKKQTKQFWPDIVGFKFKMSNIQAAIGCAQVERIADLISRKREIFNTYYENLSDIPYINMNPEPEGTINGFWMPTVIFSEEANLNITNLLGDFAKENIDARIFFWPLSSLPMFKIKTNNKISRTIAKRAINLPSFHDIEIQQQNIITNIIKKLLIQRK